MNAKIRYLYHSGFAVQTAAHFLIFDYWVKRPKGKGLESGVIDPAALKEDNVIVFASHSHRDHYNSDILGWNAVIPNLRLVLSDDIRIRQGEYLTAGHDIADPAENDAERGAMNGIIMAGPGEKISQPDFTVETLISNDEGVAFVVNVDGLCVYHAGDLNWWHWEGEPDDYNDGMANSYKAQISLLQGKRIDLAFVPVDPRLEEQYAWGINHLMQAADVRRVVPMHFGKKVSVVDRLLLDEASAGYRERIVKLTERGAVAEI